MVITMDEYINILKIMDEDINDIDKTIKIYAYINKTSIKDVEKMDINKLKQWSEKLNNYILSFKDEDELNTFIQNDEKYFVDQNVFQTNVAHYRDREVILLNRQGYDRIIPLLSMLIYKEGENPEYNSGRMNINSGRVGGLPFNIGMSAINFFINRVHQLNNISQLYSEQMIDQLQQQLKMIMEMNEMNNLNKN